MRSGADAAETAQQPPVQQPAYKNNAYANGQQVNGRGGGSSAGGGAYYNSSKLLFRYFHLSIGYFMMKTRIRSLS